MALLAGTPDATNPPQYMKDSRGIVHCRGKLTVPADNTFVLIFPAGFRPVAAGASDNFFHWAVTPNAARVVSDGSLQIRFGSVTVDLSVIHFATVLIA